jgi:hypothetical protein
MAAGVLSVSVFLGLGANMAVTAAGATDDSTSEQQQSSWSAMAASPSSGQQAVRPACRGSRASSSRPVAARAWKRTASTASGSRANR